MNKSTALKQLKELGSEATAKTYRRHGITGEMYGVKCGDMAKLAKQIGKDPSLSQQMWATGNHDARMLALAIADANQISAAQLDEWIREVDNQLLVDALVKIAANSTHAAKKAAQWSKSKQEWRSATGWYLVAKIATTSDALSEVELSGYLDVIEKTIHARPNQTRYCMNGALIAIGVRSPRLEKQALAVAKRIGVVEVDHGDTACATPDAASYIKKTVLRAKERKTVAKKTTAKKTNTKNSSAKKKTKKTTVKKTLSKKSNAKRPAAKAKSKKLPLDRAAKKS